MILRRPSFDRALRKLSPDQQARVHAATERLQGTFGRPHLHAGLGLRPIGNFFEFRAGLGLRVLFVASGGDLILVTVGDHNHITRFLRNG